MMDISIEDVRQVVCKNDNCPDVNQTYMYPVDCDDCPTCGAKIIEVEE